MKWECGRKIRCDIKWCPKYFDTVRTLRNHMVRVHKRYLDKSFYANVRYVDERLL